MKPGWQCDSEGVQLIPDVEDVETWEDLLEDEEIAWDPTRKRLLTSCPSLPLKFSPAHALACTMARQHGGTLWCSQLQHGLHMA